jgi:hypothetical protein
MAQLVTDAVQQIIETVTPGEQISPMSCCKPTQLCCQLRKQQWRCCQLACQAVGTITAATRCSTRHVCFMLYEALQ